MSLGGRGKSKTNLKKNNLRNYEESKKIVLSKKVLYFNSGYFEKKLSQFFDFVDFRHKKPPLFPIPHTIFHTKYIGMIPTVQIVLH